MRWTYGRIGDVRTRTVFLWAPRWLNGAAYWLERRTVTERYVEDFMGNEFWQPEKIE